MVLTMKTLIFFWFTERSDFKGGVLKNQYVGGDCLKRGGAWTVCWFKGGLARKKGLCFWRGWYPNAHYVCIIHCAKNECFFTKDFFSKCFLQIWSHLLKKSLMENFIFCAVNFWSTQKTRFTFSPNIGYQTPCVGHNLVGASKREVCA